LCIAAQNVRSAIVAETGWQFLKGLKMQWAYDPASPRLMIHPEQLNAGTWASCYASMVLWFTIQPP
jgi:hypothetical protein